MTSALSSALASLVDVITNGGSIVAAAVIERWPVSTVNNGRRGGNVDRQEAGSPAAGACAGAAADATPASPMTSAERRIASMTN